MQWLVVLLVALLALLVVVKVLQLLFGVVAIAIVVIGFLVARARLREWWNARGRRF